ncbi:MAG: LysR family transcriptional regulator [Comamonas sp.]
METRQLQYFVVLAEELHFSRAAKRLCISQPPLSIAIKQLETTLDAQLFERNSRGVRLTHAGQHLLAQARDILERTRRAAVDTRAVAQGMAGSLRLGFVGSSIYRGLPEALERMRLQYPDVRVDLHELNSLDQVAALQSGKLDLGLMHTLAPPVGMSAQAMVSEPFIACLAASHPLARKARIGVAELADERLILFSEAVSPDYFRVIRGMCQRAGFEPQLRHEVRHWLSVLSLVAAGQGVSLVPACLERAGMQGLAFRPIAGKTPQSVLQAMWRPLPAHPLVPILLGHLQSVAGAQRPAATRPQR